MDKIRLLRHLFSALLLLIVLAHAAGMWTIPLLESLERQTYDFRINLDPATKPDPRIVIVDIDEKSLKQVGQWPWSRNVLAAILDNLFDYYHVAVTGFDILFAEKDNSSGLKVLRHLAENDLHDNPQYQDIYKNIADELEYDQVFAKAMEGRNVVMGYYFAHTAAGENLQLALGELPDPVILVDDSIDDIPFVNTIGYGSNLPVLQQSAAHGGFIDLPLVDDDGIIRTIPMFQRYGDLLYESLSLAMVRSIMEFPMVDLHVAPGYENSDVNLGLESISLEGTFRIPVDERGAVLIPYRGPYGSFTYVSAVDVLTQEVAPEVLENAIVLVGTTAAGLLDVRSTPVQNLYPGVEIHANIIAGILDGDIKQNPAYVRGVGVVALIVIWIIMTLLSRHSGIIFLSIGSLLLAIGIYASVMYAWNQMNLVLPMATQLSFLGLLFVYYLAYSYFIENRSKRKLAKVFRQYIPPELVDELGQQQSDYGIEGETRDMTVLFSDIRGFTSMSERMQPKELTRMMNSYLTAMTEAIQENRGTIDKYIGDAIMAFWGAPIYDERHAHQALDTAMAMISRLQSLNTEFKNNGWPTIRIGVGINTGPMYVGNIGSEFRMSYTVLGDSVNLGSRLEALSKKYGAKIVVNETTKNSCPEYVYRELDRVRVVGKHEPVSVFEPIGKQGDMDTAELEELELYHKAVALYRQQAWNEARNLFMKLVQKNGRILYQDYLGRCVHYEQKPPPESWDGIFQQKGK